MTLTPLVEASRGRLNHGSFTLRHSKLGCCFLYRGREGLLAFLVPIHYFYCGLFGAKLSPSTKDLSEPTEPEATELAVSRRDTPLLPLSLSATRGRMVCMENRAEGDNHENL